MTTTLILPGATSQSVYLKAIDNTTGLSATTLTSATAGLAISYQNTQTGTVTAISLSDLAATSSAWSSGGIKHIAGGVYRLCIPDAAVPATEGARTIIAGTATAFQILGCELVGKPVEVVSGSVVAASVTGAVGSVTGAVGSVAAGGITAASIATGAVDADALAADAVAEIAADVWAYATRTLTQVASSVVTAVTGTAVTAYIGAYNSITLTGLTDFTGYKKIYFTVKADPIRNTDAQSVLQIAKSSPSDAVNDGLLYIEGAAGTKAHGSITVNSTTSITVIVKNAASSQWATRTAGYDVWYIGSDDEPRPASEGGTFVILPAVTRAAS